MQNNKILYHIARQRFSSIFMNVQFHKKKNSQLAQILIELHEDYNLLSLEDFIVPICLNSISEISNFGSYNCVAYESMVVFSSITFALHCVLSN